MCYTQIKLENKINILTNKHQNQNKKEQKMASINSFKIYGGNEKAEAEYASPEFATKLVMSSVKKFRQIHEI